MTAFEWIVAILILAMLLDTRRRHVEIVYYAKAIGMMLNELTDLAARSAPDEAEEKGADHVRGG
jgi:hypothetical protein